MGVKVFPVTVQSSTPFVPFTMPRCLRNLPGASFGTANDTLRVRLPDNRAAAAQDDCFRFPFIVFTEFAFSADVNSTGIDFGSFFEDPGIERQLTVEFPPVYNAPSIDRKGKEVLIYLRPDFVEAFTGSLSIPFTFISPRGDRHVLTLSLNSFTAFAVDRVEVNPLAKPAVGAAMATGGARLGGVASARAIGGAASPASSVTARFHLKPTEVAGDYHWALEPLGQGNPTRCFAQTTGTFTPASAATRFVDVALTRTLAAGCAGTSVTLVAWSGQPGNRSLPLYRRTVTVPAG